MRQWARIATSLTLFLVFWELIGRSGLFPAPLFPPPSKVALALFQLAREGTASPDFLAWIPKGLKGALVTDIAISLERAVVGWALGSLVGVAIGLLTGRVASLDGYITPIIQLFRPLPPVAIIPVIIVWFGIGETSKLFAIALAVFFPVWINAHLGSQKIQESFIWSAKTLGANKMTILRRVILPGSLPFIAAGLRNGVAIAFVMVYVSELAGASAGVGYEINSSYLAYRVDRMFAGLVVLGALGAFADLALTKGLETCFPWLKYAGQK